MHLTGLVPTTPTATAWVENRCKALEILREYLDSRRAIIEAALERVLRPEAGFPESLREAMRTVCWPRANACDPF